MRCLNCGNELPDGAMFCDNCGQKVEQTVNAPNNVPEEPAVPDNGQNVWNYGQSVLYSEHGVSDNGPAFSDNAGAKTFCSNCGAEVEAGTEFCGSCGAPLSPNNVEEACIFCASCGAKNPEYAQICGNCGNPLYSNNDVILTDDDVAPSGKKRSSKVWIIILIVSILVLGAAAFGVSYYFVTSRAAQEDVSEAKARSSESRESSTPKPERTPKDDKKVDASKLETYYVVNNDTGISLLESPDTSAKVLKAIPTGDPVSYVEPAENGFAKVIYNGTTGYALQSYLSNDPADAKKPDKTNSSSTAAPAAASPAAGKQSASPQKPNGVVSNPSYSTYTDPEYHFSCAYPTHFTETGSSDTFVRRAYKAPDNTATLNICSVDNYAGLSSQTVQDNFKSSYPGTVDYENKGDDWCVCRTYKDGVYHYGYFKIKNGAITGFELHFDGSYYSTYDNYVNYIYSSLNIN